MSFTRVEHQSWETPSIEQLVCSGPRERGARVYSNPDKEGLPFQQAGKRRLNMNPMSLRKAGLQTGLLFPPLSCSYSKMPQNIRKSRFYDIYSDKFHYRKRRKKIIMG